MSAGSESINVEFFGVNRQLDWLEILLVYMTKATNIWQFTTATMLNLPLK